jgi:hypothetical protein
VTVSLVAALRSLVTGGLSQCGERCGDHRKCRQPWFDIRHNTILIVRSNFRFHPAKLIYLPQFSKSKSQNP